MKTSSERFREWLTKNYTIYHNRWVLKSEIKKKNYIEPIPRSYDELHKYWTENIKDKKRSNILNGTT